jgi:hypothetical protein
MDGTPVGKSVGSVTQREPTAGNSPCRIWVDDPEGFSTSKICRLQHNFHQHPLMELSQLANLAKQLYPTQQCRFIKPGTTQRSEFGHADSSHDGKSIDEVFRRIEEPGSWVALYNVETHPQYGQFLNEVMSNVRPLVDKQQPGTFNVGGFIFISAPPSVTPFHIDRENNFWLQIAGRKTLNVWKHTDRQVVSARAVENFVLTGSLAEVRLEESLTARSYEFETKAGDGVYFPSTSPHMTRSDRNWVQPGDGVSISIGVVFYTDLTRRHSNVHACNRVLRRFGVSPTTPGESSVIDGLKYPIGRAIVAAGRLRGHQPKVGF